LLPDLPRSGFAAFFLRSGHISPFQFFSINADLIVIDIAPLCISICIRIFSPTLDRKEEILLHLRSCVVHAVAHIHGRILRVQIDLQSFILDRNVGLLVAVRGTGATRSRNAGLPRAAIGKKCACCDDKRGYREQYFCHFRTF